MKTTILTPLALMLTISAAFAEVTAAPKAEDKDRPCKMIMKACYDAGFEKGEAKLGNGLFVDCMKPILNGESVKGVTVEAATVQACQEKRSQRHDKDKVDSTKSK